MMHLPLRIFGLYLIATSLLSNQAEKTRLRVTDGTVVLTVILTKSHWNSMLVMYSVDPTNLKPVVEWDMQKPEPVAALRNTYETGQVSLAGLFSTAVRDAGFAQWKHVQGEVNAIHKLDRHYYGIFGFLACKEEGIAISSDKYRVLVRMKSAKCRIGLSLI